MVSAACQVDYKLDIIFFTPHWHQKNQLLCRKIAQKTATIELVSPEVLKAIATTVNPDGVVAIAQRKVASTPIASKTKLGLALERLQDPGNLGTIIRTAVGAGADSLWLSDDSVDLDNPKVLRASVGEWFRLPMAIAPKLSEVVQEHQQQGIQVIATASEARQNYWEIDFNTPSLILLGNEGAGLSTELIDLADETVAIPLINGVESLNVAIATGILLYEARRQLKG